MSFAAAGLALSAVGTAVGVAGAIQQGNTAQKMANYQAQVAQNNALVAEQNADYAIKAGVQEAGTESMKGAAVLGAIRAGQAASGIDVNTGSAVDVQESERERSKLDTETVMHNAQLKAYGYRTQAANFEAEAGLKQAEGAAAKKASRVSALGTLLSGASSVAGDWSKFGTTDPSTKVYTSGERDYW